MPVIQPKLSMSDVAASGIANGTLYQDGGVIRNKKTGTIFEILKDAGKDTINETQKSVTKAPTTSATAKSVSKMSIGSKFAIGTLIVVGVSALAYGGYKLYTYLSKKDDKKKHDEDIAKEEKSDVIYYNPDLTDYLNSFQTKTLSIKKIKNVIDFFDAYSNGNLEIEISDEEMMVLRNLIVRYTIKLEKANHVYLESIPLKVEAPSKDKNDLLKEINEATEIQEKIFERGKDVR